MRGCQGRTGSGLPGLAARRAAIEEAGHMRAQPLPLGIQGGGRGRDLPAVHDPQRPHSQKISPRKGVCDMCKLQQMLTRSFSIARACTAPRLVAMRVPAALLASRAAYRRAAA